MTRIAPHLLAAIREAAKDSMQDDFCTTRHEGRARFEKLVTPEIARELVGDEQPTPTAILKAIDALGQ